MKTIEERARGVWNEIVLAGLLGQTWLRDEAHERARHVIAAALCRLAEDVYEDATLVAQDAVEADMEPLEAHAIDCAIRARRREVCGE